MYGTTRYVPKGLIHFTSRNSVIKIEILALYLVLSSCGNNPSANLDDSGYNPKRAPSSAEVSSPEAVQIKLDDILTDSSEMLGEMSIPDTTGNSELTEELGPDSSGLAEMGDAMDSYQYDESGGYFSLPENEDVSREKLLQAVAVRVYQPGMRNSKDSALYVVEQRLTIVPESTPRTVIIEKWRSPVNFKGYKFNRKKVLLYGVEKDNAVVIYFYLENFYLAFDERLYELDETVSYTPFMAVKDTSLSRYLMSYEPRL